MTTSHPPEFPRIDWELLDKQRGTLALLQMHTPNPSVADDLEGILSMLWAIELYAIAMGYKPTAEDSE